jgi:hypothetical protein
VHPVGVFLDQLAPFSLSSAAPLALGRAPPPSSWVSTVVLVLFAPWRPSRPPQPRDKRSLSSALSSFPTEVNLNLYTPPSFLYAHREHNVYMPVESQLQSLSVSDIPLGVSVQFFCDLILFSPYSLICSMIVFFPC